MPTLAPVDNPPPPLAEETSPALVVVVPVAEAAEEAVVTVLLAVAVGAVDEVSKTAALSASSDSLAATRSLAGHPSSSPHALDAQHPRNGVSSWEHVYHALFEPPPSQSWDGISPYAVVLKLDARRSACGQAPSPSRHGSDVQQPRNWVLLPWQT